MSRTTRSLTLLALTTALAACQEVPTDEKASAVADRAGPEPGTHRQYGTPTALGNGQVRSYVILKGGEPLEVGIALTEGAMDGLPEEDAGHGPGGHSWVLPMPASNPTQFQHVQLNWNPMGHPPLNVYTRPHFDIHFHMISVAERLAIDPSDPLYAAKAGNYPPLDHRPAGYSAPPPPAAAAAAMPQMGIHWINLSLPEFNGSPFTQTFIFGSWNGRFIFYEPMITRAFLLSRPDAVTPIPVPAQHDPDGYYPSAYRVKWDAQQKEYRIALTNLAWYD